MPFASHKSGEYSTALTMRLQELNNCKRRSNGSCKSLSSNYRFYCKKKKNQKGKQEGRNEDPANGGCCTRMLQREIAVSVTDKLIHASIKHSLEMILR